MQLTAGTLSAILAGLVMHLLPSVSQKVKRKKVIKKQNIRNAPGGVTVVGDDNITGDISVDNSKQVVVQNISATPGGRTDSDPAQSDGQIWIAVIVAVIGAGLFVLYYEFVVFFCIGACIGLLVNAVATIRQAIHLRLWDSRASLIVVEVILTLTAAAFSSWSQLNTVYAGLRLEELSTSTRSAMPPIDADNGITGYVEWLLAPSKHLIEANQGLEGLAFVLCLMASLVLSLVLQFDCWRRLRSWGSYLTFFYGTVDERWAKRANRFLQYDWKSAVGFAIAVGLAIAMAMAAPLRVPELFS